MYADKKGAWTCCLDFSTSLHRTAIPHKNVETTKAHVTVWDVSRQPFFLVIIFFSEFAVREDYKESWLLNGCKDSTNL